MRTPYVRRAVDDLLDENMDFVPAVVIEGPKGVGKTETARQRAQSVFELDRLSDVEVLQASPEMLERTSVPVLVDEWQRYLPSWDLVRRAVDKGAAPGSYLLTGSAFPVHDSQIHSGAARIDTVRMRPFALFERRDVQPLVRLRALFENTQASDPFVVDLELADYVREICRSGLPSIMGLPEKIRRVRLGSYIELLATHEFPQQGLNVRNPRAVAQWLAAYARNTAKTTSYTEILDAATPGEAAKPARATADRYRALLEQLMILEPLPAWIPLVSGLPKLAKTPKHHLCDPALAAHLLSVNEGSLYSGDAKQRELLAQLFESLTVLSLRVAAEVEQACCYHLRTAKGEHEIDVLIEDSQQRVVAVEVKLSSVIQDGDVRHLHWLKQQIGSRFAAGVVVHAGRHFYKRPDGIWVVPLGALG